MVMHPWDHAKWLLYRGGLFTEVGGALVDGLCDLLNKGSAAIGADSHMMSHWAVNIYI